MFYNPDSGVAMARDAADSANEYADMAAIYKDADRTIGVGAFSEFGGLLCIAGGPPGIAAGTGLGTSIGTALYDRMDGVSVKDSLIDGGEKGVVSGVVAYGVGAAASWVGQRIVGALARNGATAAIDAAGASSRGVIAPLKPNCFVAGTLVQMADGTTKLIEQVVEGDLVLSRDSADKDGSGAVSAHKVLRIFQHVAPEGTVVLHFCSANGEISDTTECTPGHPFFVEGRGFVYAADLGIGTSIVTRAGPGEGNVAIVTAIERKTAAATVYNFEVEGDHTYFVGTINGGEWVHNVSNVVWPGTFTESEALTEGADWVGDPQEEKLGRLGVPGMGVFRSTNKTGIIRQFRMGPDDLDGAHEVEGLGYVPHVHFQEYNQAGKELWNLHVPIVPDP